MPESPVFKEDLLNRFTIPLSGTKFTKVQTFNRNIRNYSFHISYFDIIYFYQQKNICTNV